MEGKKIKICFAASSGGHFEQLLMLKPLMENTRALLLRKKQHIKYKSTMRKRIILNK